VLGLAVTLASDPNPRSYGMGRIGSLGMLRPPPGRTTAVSQACLKTTPPLALGSFMIVMLALDGVRADELFAGPDRARTTGLETESLPKGAAWLPNIREIYESGGVALGVPAHGPPMVASGPRYISLPGYLEMLTGRFSGCTSNYCNVKNSRTLIDEIATQPEIQRGDVAAFASWSRLGSLFDHGSGRVLLSAGRARTAHADLLRANQRVAEALDAGSRATAFPGHDGYRPDRHTARVALGWLRAQRPVFTFMSLGDADEYAHRGDYYGYLRSVSFADSVIGEINRVLESERRRGRKTLLLITADHGRSRGFVFHDRDPESARVWLLAAGSVIDRRGIVESIRQRHLRDVAPTIRSLIGLPHDPSRFAGSVLTELL
jgi:hypothetical protein